MRGGDAFTCLCPGAQCLIICLCHLMNGFAAVNVGNQFYNTFHYQNVLNSE